MTSTIFVIDELRSFFPFQTCHIEMFIETSLVASLPVSFELADLGQEAQYSILSFMRSSPAILPPLSLLPVRQGPRTNPVIHTNGKHDVIDDRGDVTQSPRGEAQDEP